MGKAQKFKAERRAARLESQVVSDQRRHLGRWLVGLAIFAALAVIVFPWADHRLAHDAIRKSLGYQPTPKPAATITPTGGPVESVGTKVAVIETPKGRIVMELYGDKAPNTVKHITDLISKGFYNGLTFHRVEPGFVIQGGDPQGNGTGGSGQNVKFEVNDLKHDKGAVAMARSQSKDSGDSQFYITLAPQPSLDGEYVVFGKVISGMDVVEKIAVGDKMTKVTLQ